MNNKLDSEYRDSETSINEKSWIWALPEELYETDMIDWLQDEVDAYKFHNDEDCLDFVKNSWFDKIYHIAVYPNDIDQYKDIKSVYALLTRCKNSAWLGKLQLVIFRKWKDKYLSKEDADKMISDYANEYLSSTEKTRKEIIDVLKDTYNVSDLWDEKLKEKIIESLNTEPTYWRIISNWWKYKYLVGWWKWSKAESGKHYINVIKDNWINIVEIK